MDSVCSLGNADIDLWWRAVDESIVQPGKHMDMQIREGGRNRGREVEGQVQVDGQGEEGRQAGKCGSTHEGTQQSITQEIFQGDLCVVGKNNQKNSRDSSNTNLSCAAAR